MATAKIPDWAADLFEKASPAFLATVMPDGTPHVTPVWVDRDGDRVLVNTARGRVKDRNFRRNAKVGLVVSDGQNAYRYLSLQGEVAEIREEGADAHIDKLAKSYLGKDTYPFRRPDEVREIVVIEPRRLHGMG